MSFAELVVSCELQKFCFVLVFDPNVEIDLGNPEYVKIYEEYKNLVDYMLGSFMEEMAITTDQFEMACLEGKSLKSLSKDEPEDSHSFSLQRGLFQQIWAANDIRIFVNLMVKRNVEIQLQALDLIEKQQSFSSSIDEPSRPEEEEELAKEIEVKIETENHNDDDHNDVANKFERLNLFFEKQNLDSADISQRKEYFYSQRDKILKTRLEHRSRKLRESIRPQDDDTPESVRPSSSRVAAQRFIAGERLDSASEKAVELRKALAKKLREEVVDKTTGD